MSSCKKEDSDSSSSNKLSVGSDSKSSSSEDKTQLQGESTPSSIGEDGGTLGAAQVKSSAMVALRLTKKAKAQTQPATKMSPIRSLYAELVHVIVGPDKKDFGIHKGLLCRRSRFFKAACNGSFSEASKGTVELPEEDVETFAIVYTWLYSGKITLEKDGKDVACACFHFAQLWIFGDKFDMPSLCDEAIDGILHEYQDKNVIMMAYARPIYSSTAKDSMLRKALVATYIGIGAKLASFLETNAASL